MTRGRIKGSGRDRRRSAVRARSVEWVRSTDNPGVYLGPVAEADAAATGPLAVSEAEAEAAADEPEIEAIG